MKHSEIKTKSETDLKKLLSEKLEVQRTCLFRVKADEKNTKLHKNTRKDIARIKTAYNEKAN